MHFFYENTTEAMVPFLVFFIRRYMRLTHFITGDINVDNMDKVLPTILAVYALLFISNVYKLVYLYIIFSINPLK